MSSTGSFGEFIRKQREFQELSLRQFAEQVGISNPYLSQIEHGHREPSQRVLEAMAQALQLNADLLYEQAGRRAPAGNAEDGAEPPVVAAIREDERLTGRQRQALLEVYASFTGWRRPRPDQGSAS
jgi:transcriptional regulator with XRE-family HTH domain